MTTGADIAEVAALVGDPGRANMLDALMDGRALTATELAHAAGVSAATASGHLARMTRGGLLVAVSQGRCRYFRLASPQVARMLESIALVAVPPPPCRRATPRVPVALREARTCYDHLAGRLGVALADALVARGAVVLTEEAGEVTESGRGLLQAFGIAVELRRTRRLYCRPCLDWSERRPHLAGVLGAALLDRTLDLGWIMRQAGVRAVDVTAKGRRGFADVFGVELDA
jgi:DNA-binding transcriptional ArsR family regulator